MENIETTSKNKPKERIIYLDILRIFACVLIVLMHSPRPDSGMSGYQASSISLLTAPGIGLFFMVSGALLLPVRISSSAFWRRRISKIIFPVLCWTLFYVIDNYFYGGATVREILRSLLSFPFRACGRGFLWFMYTLTGLYLLAPILSPWLLRCSRRELEAVLLFWCVTMFYPLLKGFFDIDDSTGGILYYFSGYAGYFLLGHYLHKYTPRLRWWCLLLCFIVPVGCAVYCKTTHLQIDFYNLFWYLSIFIAVMCFAWFNMIQRFFSRITLLSRLSGALTTLSNCTFGMFLMHIFLMRRCIWSFPYFREPNGGVLQSLLIFATTFLLSFLFTYLLSFLPFATYIIGYKRTKKQ